MPGGRPTLYRPAYCQAVADFHTITEFARHIGVVFQTVYEWTYTHPDFAEAVKTMTRSLPTRYRPDYCEAVVDCLKDGHSLYAFAGQIDVDHKTLYRWMDKHPDFADAVKRAQAQSALWWEKRLLELAQGDTGNARAVIFGLKNRGAGHWRDSVHTEVSGRLDQVHRIERVIVRPGEAGG